MSTADRVRDFFGRHARAYTHSPGHRSGRDLERMVRLLAPAAGEWLLDVATGPGHLAFALAPHATRVVGVDLTLPMASQFLAEAARRGLAGPRVLCADAGRLPLAPEAFHLVTCRRAAHHFPDLAAALAEMVRVLRPGGRLGIIDLATPADSRAAALVNAMERARDGSHAGAYSLHGWRRLLEGQGLEIQATEEEVEDLSFHRWLYPVPADGPEASQAMRLAREAPPSVAAGVVWQAGDGAWMYRKIRVLLVARK